MTMLPAGPGRRPLSCHTASEGAFLINPAHPASFRRQPPNPHNVETRHNAQHVQGVVPAGEPADGYGPVEPHKTWRFGKAHPGQVPEATGRRNQVPCRLRRHIETVRNPLTQSAAPSRQHTLPAVNLTQQHHLRRPKPTDLGFVVEQPLLNLVDRGGLYIHTPNLSTGHDRNRGRRRETSGFFELFDTEMDLLRSPAGCSRSAAGGVHVCHMDARPKKNGKSVRPSVTAITAFAIATMVAVVMVVVYVVVQLSGVLGLIGGHRLATGGFG